MTLNHLGARVQVVSHVRHYAWPYGSPKLRGRMSLFRRRSSEERFMRHRAETYRELVESTRWKYDVINAGPIDRTALAA